MSDGQELIKSDAAFLAETPKDVVARATAQAEALMAIVKERKLYQAIGGHNYLQVEAWTTIGRFNHASPVVEYCRPVERDGKIAGYEAKVNIMRDGLVEASAVSLCGLDEPVCRGRKGLAAENACMSMAQTRATSKALRLAYSFVAVLAGFEATPAEEMAKGEPDVDEALAEFNASQGTPAPTPASNPKPAAVSAFGPNEFWRAMRNARPAWDRLAVEAKLKMTAEEWVKAQPERTWKMAADAVLKGG